MNFGAVTVCDFCDTSLLSVTPLFAFADFRPQKSADFRRVWRILAAGPTRKLHGAWKVATGISDASYSSMGVYSEASKPALFWTKNPTLRRGLYSDSNILPSFLPSTTPISTLLHRHRSSAHQVALALFHGQLHSTTGRDQATWR